MKRILILACALAAAAALQACARAQARVPAEAPPLDVPSVPPRQIASVEEPAAEAPEPASQTDTGEADGRPVRRPVRPAPARPEPAGEPEAPAPKAEPAAGDASSSQPVLQLRTSPSNEGELARQIRGIIERAAGTLSRVDYAALNDDARAQYDTAKRFIEQTGEALKVQNFVAARYLADKADTIARQLSGR